MQNNEFMPSGSLANAPVRSLANPRHRILVVDNDRDLRLLYTDALTRPGYDVDAAEDGAAGWEALQTTRYHLLITEHSLPNLTGVELVRKLRTAQMALPVVMAAERLPVDELARNPSLQLTALLPKPFYISQLLETVRSVLRWTGGVGEQLDLLPNWRSQTPADGLRVNAR